MIPQLAEAPGQSRQRAGLLEILSELMQFLDAPHTTASWPQSQAL